MIKEDDWLMSQLKGIANMVGQVLRLEVSQLDLGSVEDEEGNLLDGAFYLDNLLKTEQFLQANRFIKSKMKILNHHEYSLLVDNYIAYLLRLDETVLRRHGLTTDKITQLKAHLNQFEW